MPSMAMRNSYYPTCSTSRQSPGTAPSATSSSSMPRKANASTAPAPTTAQALGSLLKSARDIMRKDKGLNGDLDRLPLLTWIMFLKFLDDLERQREDEAKLAGKPFRRAIE